MAINLTEVIVNAMHYGLKFHLNYWNFDKVYANAF